MHPTLRYAHLYTAPGTNRRADAMAILRTAERIGCERIETAMPEHLRQAKLQPFPSDAIDALRVAVRHFTPGDGMFTDMSDEIHVAAYRALGFPARRNRGKWGGLDCGTGGDYRPGARAHRNAALIIVAAVYVALFGPELEAADRDALSRPWRDIVKEA